MYLSPILTIIPPMRTRERESERERQRERERETDRGRGIEREIKS